MVMWSKLGLVGVAVLGASVVACSGSDGAAGAKGDPGQPGPAGSGTSSGSSTPSVSGVTPSRAFVARTAEVTISGFGSTWSGTTTADFGAGVTVKKLVVASPTALLATIDISKTAATGPHDVTITDGATKEVYKAAFHVDAPVSLTTLGTVAQGSIVVAQVKEHDLSTPFDTTQTGDGLFTPISYPNLAATAGPGVTASVGTPSLYALDLTMLIDVTAAAAAQTVNIASGPQGDTIDNPAPNAFTIAARTPKALAAGTPATGTITKAYESELYTFVPGATLSVVDLAATGAGTGAKPAIVLLPKSGKFADLISFKAKSTLVTTNADPFYAIFWDNTGTTGAYTIAATSAAATALAADANATAKATAQTATALPLVLQGAKLASATDEHWVKYTAVAGDVGKRFHVQTLAGDPRADMLVEVFQANGTTTLGGPSDDNAYHEDWLTPAIPAAGVYYVKFSASTQGFSASQTAFVGVIRVIQ